MEISCLDVIQALSNYIDDDVEPGLRSEITTHLSTCKHCTAVFDGTRNLIRLVSDEKIFDLPAGFSQRLREKLAGDNRS